MATKLTPKMKALHKVDFNQTVEEIEDKGIDFEKLKSALILIQQASDLLSEMPNVQMFANDGQLACRYTGEQGSLIQDDAIAWIQALHSKWDGGYAD